MRKDRGQLESIMYYKITNFYTKTVEEVLRGDGFENHRETLIASLSELFGVGRR